MKRLGKWIRTRNGFTFFTVCLSGFPPIRFPPLARCRIKIYVRLFKPYLHIRKNISTLQVHMTSALKGNQKNKRLTFKFPWKRIKLRKYGKDHSGNGLWECPKKGISKTISHCNCQWRLELCGKQHHGYDPMGIGRKAGDFQ